jgi:hypothetical protein
MTTKIYRWLCAFKIAFSTKTLVRRGKKWFRYDAPDKRLFEQLQKTLTASAD